MYEHRNKGLLPRPQFALRVVGHLSMSGAAVFVVLGAGVLGYHFLGRLAWIDALLNASMILGGMGPVDPLPGTGAKVFASLYALFSGLFFIAMAGLVVAPFLHRLLHRLHADEETDET